MVVLRVYVLEQKGLNAVHNISDSGAYTMGEVAK